MTRENYSLLWRRAAPKTIAVQDPQEPEPDPDDLSTWPSSATFQTEALPFPTGAEDPDPEQGVDTTVDPLVVHLVFEVTKVLTTAAKNDVNGLRFTGPGGVHLGHLRTATNRIFVAGQFTTGHRIQITYYWGKTNQSQPGIGFPSSAAILSNFRLFLLFENNAPRDYSADPAQWTIVGAPTFASGRNGQLMICGPGNYIQTMAAKLRSDARDQRHAMALIRTPDDASSGRIICWADWSNNQRAFQLFSKTDYVELYIDEDGVSPFQRWTNKAPFSSGYSMIGCSWIAGQEDAIVQRDRNASFALKEFDTPIQGPLHDSTSPYIIGGTPVADTPNYSDVEAALEKTSLTRNEMAAYDLAWRENEAFLGFDRTPDAFVIPSLSNQERSTEVVFAKVQIKGMSSGTSISISGNGNPAYAISSSSAATDDVLSKRTTASTIDPGQWVRVWQTTSSAYVTPQISKLTIGTLSVDFQSTTKAAAGTGGGGSAIPTGPATYTVNSLSALKDTFNNNLQPGQILEIPSGDYLSEGGLTLSDKDFSGNSPPVIRASVRAYRGQLPSEGGTLVPNDTRFRSGSGGAEFGNLKLTRLNNVVFDGIRTYTGVPNDKAGERQWYGGDLFFCQNLQFQYCKFTGTNFDPKASYSILHSAYQSDYPWYKATRGIQVGDKAKCAHIKFKKCLFSQFGYMQLFLANVDYPVVEDCAFMNSAGDHIMTSGEQRNAIIRRCVFYQAFVRRSSSGGMPHLDIAQNTAQDQNCAVNHLYEFLLSGPGEGNYAHWQGPFLEADKYPTFREALGFVLKDSVFEHRAMNTIYVRPANGVVVDRVSVIQNQWGGWFEDVDRDDEEKPTGTTIKRWQGDWVRTNPMVVWNAKTANGKSFGNNKVSNSVIMGVDSVSGDEIINCTNLDRSGYPTHLYDYPTHTGKVSGRVLEGHPNYRPCKFLNEYGAINPTELRRMAPKFSSSLHPDKKGGHYGGSALFELYGALPTS